jgi:hypothetical protein
MASPPVTGPLDPTTGSNLGYGPPAGTTGPSDLQIALQRRSAVLAALAAAPTGPFVVSEGGRSVDLIAYRKSLTDELKQLNELIPILAGPFQMEQRLGRR